MVTFDHLTAVAAPLPMDNIDTDKILAGRFLKTITRAGLGKALFHALRFDSQGFELPEFILNRSPWREARILITLANFGCGSSREHAPWALQDFGIQVIIAPSFADIFYNNCFKNGLLAITLERRCVEHLLEVVSGSQNAELSVDLPTQTISTLRGDNIPFEIASGKKRSLLLGLDEIAQTMTQSAAIEIFEVTRQYPVTSIRPDIGASRASFSKSYHNAGDTL